MLPEKELQSQSVSSYTYFIVYLLILFLDIDQILSIIRPDRCKKKIVIIIYSLMN